MNSKDFERISRECNPQKIQDAYIGKRFTRKKGEQIPFRFINI